MADQKISELTALTGANVADDDAIAIVDTSATETKKIVFSELKNALDTATGFVRITGDTMTGNLSMGDNVKAIFGAGSDLQIYHNPTGSHSYITESGGGSLYIQGTELNLTNAAGTSTYANFVDGGAAFIRHAGSTKLATSSGGVDISGTLTSDGLTVDGDGTFSATNPTVDIKATNGNDASLILMETTGNDFGANGANGFRSRYDGGDNALYIQSGAETTIRNRIKVDRDTGDISFYEDTGSTAKFFWDASAESLGIGTSSPSGASGRTLAINGGSGQSRLALKNTNTGDASGDGFQISIGTDGSAGIEQRENNYMAFLTNATERMRISSDGSCRWTPDGSNPDMTLDASGNLLVGKTATDSGVVGFEAAQDGHVYVTVNNTLPLYINRQSGAELLRFASNGTTVGSISVLGSRMNIGTGDVAIRFDDTNNAIIPWNVTTNGSRADSIDFGDGTDRFKDLYLSGTIEIANGTNNVGVGKTALNSNTGANNTALGFEAGYSNSTGVENTYLGRNAGYYVTTGNKNTIVGAFHGNQGGLDIRTSSNNIVLSDGDGNPYYWGRASGTHVYSSETGAATAFVSAINSTNTSSQLFRGANSASNINDVSATQFVVFGTGNVQNTNNSYGAISDQKLKENIVDAGSQWDDIKAIRVRKYSLIADAETTANRLGVIAQELEASGMSGLVEEHIDLGPNDEDLGTTTKGVKYSVLYMKAIKALQEAMDRIETLEAKVTALENA